MEIQFCLRQIGWNGFHSLMAHSCFHSSQCDRKKSLLNFLIIVYLEVHFSLDVIYGVAYQ